MATKQATYRRCPKCGEHHWHAWYNLCPDCLPQQEPRPSPSEEEIAERAAAIKAANLRAMAARDAIDDRRHRVIEPSAIREIRTTQRRGRTGRRVREAVG